MSFSVFIGRSAAKGSTVITPVMTSYGRHGIFNPLVLREPVPAEYRKEYFGSLREPLRGISSRTEMKDFLIEITGMPELSDSIRSRATTRKNFGTLLDCLPPATFRQIADLLIVADDPALLNAKSLLRPAFSQIDRGESLDLIREMLGLGKDAPAGNLSTLLSMGPVLNRFLSELSNGEHDTAILVKLLKKEHWDFLEPGRVKVGAGWWAIQQMSSADPRVVDALRFFPLFLALMRAVPKTEEPLKYLKHGDNLDSAAKGTAAVPPDTKFDLTGTALSQLACRSEDSVAAYLEHVSSAGIEKGGSLYDSVVPFVAENAFEYTKKMHHLPAPLFGGAAAIDLAAENARIAANFLLWKLFRDNNGAQGETPGGEGKVELVIRRFRFGKSGAFNTDYKDFRTLNTAAAKLAPGLCAFIAEMGTFGSMPVFNMQRFLR